MSEYKVSPGVPMRCRRSQATVVAVRSAWLTVILVSAHPKMDCGAALHRLNVGVPATVEHSSEEGVETAKWVAETTQVRSNGG